MRRRRGLTSPRREAGAMLSDERILPLIDVVFLLLIFFMLAGRLSERDPFPVAPPEIAGGAPVEVAPLTLLMGAGGELALDGERLALAELGAALAERRTETGLPRLRLKADGSLPAARVVAVMERLREAGIERLELLNEAVNP